MEHVTGLNIKTLIKVTFKTRHEYMYYTNYYRQIIAKEYSHKQSPFMSV